MNDTFARSLINDGDGRFKCGLGTLCITGRIHGFNGRSHGRHMGAIPGSLSLVYDQPFLR